VLAQCKLLEFSSQAEKKNKNILLAHLFPSRSAKRSGASQAGKIIRDDGNGWIIHSWHDLGVLRGKLNAFKQNFAAEHYTAEVQVY
jgi:hypothetical protein